MWVSSAASIFASPGAARLGSILKTTNGGASWVSVLDSDTSRFVSVSAVGANVAWAVGRAEGDGPGAYLYAIYRTANGGATWSRLWEEPSYVGRVFITAHDAQRAEAVGLHDVLLQTKDGGTTWSRQRLGLMGGGASGLAWATPDIAWAVGDGGIILKTVTRGE